MLWLKKKRKLILDYALLTRDLGYTFWGGRGRKETANNILLRHCVIKGYRVASSGDDILDDILDLEPQGLSLNMGFLLLDLPLLQETLIRGTILEPKHFTKLLSHVLKQNNGLTNFSPFV